MDIKIKTKDFIVDATMEIADGVILVSPVADVELREEKKGPITERVKTYEDACKELGRQPYNEDQLMKLGLTKNDIAYQKMVVIVEALNEGWKPDWNDSNERKCFPWFWMSPSSFAFDASCCGCGFADAGSGSRLKLKSDELAEYCGKQFVDIWKDIQLG